MSSLFPDSNSPSTSRLSLLLGCGASVLVLLFVPILQLLKEEEVAPNHIEMVELSAPPPPPVFDLPPPPPVEEEPPPPELDVPPPMPTLEELEVSLNPGTDGALNEGLGFDFDLGAESVGQLEDLFGFGELDEVPTLVREGRFRYPSNAPRGRGEGAVRLLVYIEADGRISVQDVVDYSHPEFVEPAKRMAENSRFSTPTKNGQAVRSKYEWPFSIPLK